MAHPQGASLPCHELPGRILPAGACHIGGKHVLIIEHMREPFSQKKHHGHAHLTFLGPCDTFIDTFDIAGIPLWMTE